MKAREERAGAGRGSGVPGGVRAGAGAREHNLENVDVDIPRDALVVFIGESDRAKSSLAFGALYAQAQRRYLEWVAPYARQLFSPDGHPRRRRDRRHSARRGPAVATRHAHHALVRRQRDHAPFHGLTEPC
jgi:hypothetical protein